MSEPDNITSSTCFESWRRCALGSRKFSTLKIDEGISALRAMVSCIVLGMTEAGHQNIHTHILESDIAMGDVVLVEESECLVNFQ